MTPHRDSRQPPPRTRRRAASVVISALAAAGAVVLLCTGSAWQPADRAVLFDRAALFALSGAHGLTPSSPNYFLPENPALEAEAHGAYDWRFAQLARQLVAAGDGAAVIRLGWEMNGGWYSWSQRRCPPSDPRCFGEAWRHVITAMRSAPGQRFTFLWTVYDSSADPVLAWPGSSYVDLVGDDVYDWHGGPHRAYPSSGGKKDHAAEWQRLLSYPTGLDWLAAFGSQMRKPIAVPEWGLAYQTFGGGDDPYYVDHMLRWQRDHHVALSVYWGPGQLGAASSPPAGPPLAGLGAYGGPGDVAGLNALGQLLGRPLQYASDFLPLQNWVSPATTAPVLAAWKPTSYRLVLSIPMVPLTGPAYHGPPAPPVPALPAQQSGAVFSRDVAALFGRP
jgi:hypothetical protein